MRHYPRIHTDLHGYFSLAPPVSQSQALLQPVPRSCHEVSERVGTWGRVEDESAGRRSDPYTDIIISNKRSIAKSPPFVLTAHFSIGVPHPMAVAG